MRLALFSCLRPIERIFIGLLALAFLVMVSPFAFAETVLTKADVTPAVNWGFGLFSEVVVPVMLTIATGLTGWLGTLIKKKTGIDATIATAAANQMLHAAIQRGVEAMEQEFRGRLYGADGRVNIPVQNAAISWVITRTSDLLPETLDKLGVDNARLRRLVTEKVTTYLTPKTGETPPAPAATLS